MNSEAFCVEQKIKKQKSSVSEEADRNWKEDKLEEMELDETFVIRSWAKFSASTANWKSEQIGSDSLWRINQTAETSQLVRPCPE